jgi:hypothetical protein
MLARMNSDIAFIMYVHNQEIGKPNNSNVVGSNKMKNKITNTPVSEEESFPFVIWKY